MTATTRIERSGPAIYAALLQHSPDEGARFEREYRNALTQAANTFDLADADSVLSRWWGIAILRANPPSEEERQLIQRLQAGEDVGWPSPAAWLQAQQPAASP